MDISLVTPNGNITLIGHIILAVITLVVVPGTGWVIALAVKRSIDSSDKLQEVRHKNLADKITKFCEENGKEHLTIWNHHEHHTHDNQGRTIYTGVA